MCIRARLRVSVGARAQPGVSVCVRACHAPSEDGADVHAVALLSHTVQHASKRRDFPSLFQISQAVQMGTGVFPK